MVRAVSTLSPADRDVVCSAMANRGMVVSDCLPRGEVTLFQSSTSQLVIDDPRLIERITLVTDARSSVVLLAPDGSVANDLASLRGRSAAGTWTLQGVFRSWSLLIQFAGDAPLAERPVTAAPRKHIAAVAHAAGENDTLWITDVRVLNRGAKTANVTVIYTPDAGGFAAVKLVIAPQQVVALNDVVGTIMQTFGLGALEFQGDVADLVVTSRTYSGFYGQFVAGTNTSDAIGAGQRAVVAHLRSDAEFRSNAGFTEVAGASGVVRMNGADINVAPFQHVQMAVSGETQLEVVSGNARILGYGSMIDNTSGDAIYVPARVPPSSAHTEYAPAVNAAGLFGTHWFSEVVFSAAGQTGAQFTARFANALATGPVPFRFSNILRELFEREETLGLLRVDLPAGVTATSRIFTRSGAGTFGQFVPFTSSAHGGDLIQVEVSPDFRTNVGFANIGSAPVTVHYSLLGADGTLRGEFVAVLQPSELVQFPVTVFNVARVRVDGDVLAYASTVDNRSGDAIFTPAQ